MAPVVLDESQAGIVVGRNTAVSDEMAARGRRVIPTASRSSFGQPVDYPPFYAKTRGEVASIFGDELGRERKTGRGVSAWTEQRYARHKSLFRRERTPDKGPAVSSGSEPPRKRAPLFLQGYCISKMRSRPPLFRYSADLGSQAANYRRTGHLRAAGAVRPGDQDQEGRARDRGSLSACPKHLVTSDVWL